MVSVDGQIGKVYVCLAVPLINIIIIPHWYSTLFIILYHMFKSALTWSHMTNALLRLVLPTQVCRICLRWLTSECHLGCSHNYLSFGPISNGQELLSLSNKPIIDSKDVINTMTHETSIKNGYDLYWISVCA